ncbi:GlsB/YeaQ/YmgE family stress response membrane protein [Roseibium sp.]|uniref:GlsB/YeaQ/YmgE family stress response membrane protein n=1 Tax=Roseibium sp. TaxID=1936156 RepID=UPI003D11857E
MDVKAILIWVVIGILAGWLASVVVGGGGLIRYLITGLIGAFVGGFLFNVTGININLGNAYVNQIVVAAIGAVVVVLLARLIA